MGGLKGTGAFAKNSEDAAQLLRMFMTKQLCINAEPNDVVSLFPNNENKTATQIRSGFNRVREMAKMSLQSMGEDGNGKVKKKLFIKKIICNAFFFNLNEFFLFFIIFYLFYLRK
jgi:hypothetical protein